MKKTVAVLSILSIFSVACSKNEPHDSIQLEQQQKVNSIKKNQKLNSDDCFQLEPSFEFTLNNDDFNIKIESTEFNNQKAIAVIKTGNGIRTDYIYDLTGRTMLANLDYGIAALGSNPNEVLVKTTFQAPLPTFPSNMKPQQKFPMTYNAVIQSQTDENDKTENKKTIEVEFVGFEDLKFIDNNNNTLEFNQACHFKSQLEDETLDEWYAQGFGQIKFVRTKANGDVKSSEAIGDEPEPTQ